MSRRWTCVSNGAEGLAIFLTSSSSSVSNRAGRRPAWLSASSSSSIKKKRKREKESEEVDSREKSRQEAGERGWGILSTTEEQSWALLVTRLEVPWKGVVLVSRVVVDASRRTLCRRSCRPKYKANGSCQTKEKWVILESKRHE